MNRFNPSRIANHITIAGTNKTVVQRIIVVEIPGLIPEVIDIGEHAQDDVTRTINKHWRTSTFFSPMIYE
jgi:Tfp pilus assembly PilM family ATPase